MDIKCPYHYGMDERIKAICNRIEIQLDGQKEALRIARDEMDRRLKDTFATITDMQLSLKKMEDRISEARGPLLGRVGSIEIQEAKESASAIWKNYIITVMVSLGVVLILHYIFKF